MEHLAFTFRLTFLLSITIFLASSATASEDDQLVYSGFSGSNLTLNGAAMVTQDGVLELTNGKPDYMGYAFYPSSWKLRGLPDRVVQSFSVSFVFGIASVDFNGCPNSMNFSIHQGLTNKSMLAVVLEACHQDNNFQENNDNDVSISIGGKSLAKSPAGFFDGKSGIFNNLPLLSHNTMQMWVEYDLAATQINVTLAPLEVVKPLRPLLSLSHNLSTVLGDSAYIGLLASTSITSLRYSVLGWSFGMNRPAPTIDIAKLPQLPRVDPKAQSKLLKIILPIAMAILVLLVGTMVILFVRGRMRYAELYEDWEHEFGPHRFSYKDLFQATEGFHNKNLLGRGGFGKVYKSVVPVSKLQVAVKRVSHESKQGIKEFIAEVVSIGRLRHRNLVQLLGYCRRKGELLLVYEYMPNGSLEKYLYVEADKTTLDWAQRLQIIKGVASAIFYLHEKWEKVVIHRDI